MKPETKILILIILFAVKGVIHLFDGVMILSSRGSYGDYGDAFITAAIMGYLAYAIYSTRRKWTYWIAVFFAGLIIVRFVMAMGIQIYSTDQLPAGLLVFSVMNGVLFGLIPLLLLFEKGIRNEFLRD